MSNTTKKTERMYYFECDFGCGIRAATSEQTVRSEVLREFGSMAGNIITRRATKEDIAWVGSMGGHVPEQQA